MDSRECGPVDPGAVVVPGRTSDVRKPRLGSPRKSFPRKRLRWRLAWIAWAPPPEPSVSPGGGSSDGLFCPR